MQTILLATDLTQTSSAAESLARTLADAHSAKLIVVHVTPGQPTNHLGPLYGGLQDPEIPQVARKLAAIKPIQDKSTCEHRILVGDPAREVLNVASQEKVDLIILGTHGRSVAKRLILGNVAERVLRQATAAVYVCKGPSRLVD